VRFAVSNGLLRNAQTLTYALIQLSERAAWSGACESRLHKRLAIAKLSPEGGPFPESGEPRRTNAKHDDHTVDASSGTIEGKFQAVCALDRRCEHALARCCCKAGVPLHTVSAQRTIRIWRISRSGTRDVPAGRSRDVADVPQRRPDDVAHFAKPLSPKM